MIKINTIVIFCCVFFSCGISFNKTLSQDTAIKVTDIDEVNENIYSQQNIVDQNNTSAKTTLHRNSFSSNTSELFAKVIDMEEQLHALNGRLENAERSNLELTKQLHKMHKQMKNLVASNTKSGFTQASKKYENNSQYFGATNLKHSINLIKAGKNTEAIKLLNSTLQKARSQKKQFSHEGEVYYWLAKAYTNQKSSDKAVYYFTKSYKYYSNVKLNGILVNLIGALESNKKYKQICPLLNKLDVKYLNTLSKNKQNKIRNLKNLHCKT